MLLVLDGRGGANPARNRVSLADHWDIYRRAVMECPGLVETMYQMIEEAVNQQVEADQTVLNSTWLGSELLSSWHHTPEWDALCRGSQDLSSALFGEIMWTVMFDDEDRDWCTMKTPEANIGREERVYFLRND